MFPPNEMERLLHEIGELNTTFFPAYPIVALIAITLTALCYFRPSTAVSKLMKAFLALIYAMIAYGVAVCAFHLRGIYYIFTATTHSAVAIMLAVSVFKDEVQFALPAQRDLRILSIVLTIYGIFIYPLAELLLGYRWPEVFVFPSLCPATVFAEGVLIAAIQDAHKSKLYKWLLGILSTGAVVCATRTILIGGIFDLSYLASGIVGFYALLKYSKGVPSASVTSEYVTQ